MQLVEHIDRHVPKRGSGPSVGAYLLAAVLNRCLAPGSKASLARWFDSTVLGRLLPLRSSQLTSQRFWDHMHRVPVSALPAIERDIVAAMTREFGLDLRQVLFDATNFFTYIDSFNERSQLAQRGHSKEGRRSLRIIGVALLITADFRLPLLHRTYPGNRPDAPLFQSLAADFPGRSRHRLRCSRADLMQALYASLTFFLHSAISSRVTILPPPPEEVSLDTKTGVDRLKISPARTKPKAAVQTSFFAFCDISVLLPKETIHREARFWSTQPGPTG